MLQIKCKRKLHQITGLNDLKYTVILKNWAKINERGNSNWENKHASVTNWCENSESRSWLTCVLKFQYCWQDNSSSSQLLVLCLLTWQTLSLWRYKLSTYAISSSFLVEELQILPSTYLTVNSTGQQSKHPHLPTSLIMILFY